MQVRIIDGEMARATFRTLSVDQVFPFTRKPTDGGLFMSSASGLYVMYDERDYPKEEPALALIGLEAEDSPLLPMKLAVAVGENSVTWIEISQDFAFVLSVLSR